MRVKSIYFSFVIWMLFFSSASVSAELPGENSGFCSGLSVDSFDRSSEFSGVFDGKWDGQASSTLIISRMGDGKVEGWYAFGLKKYCEKFSGAADDVGRISFTASWGQPFSFEFDGADLVKGRYSYRGSDSYADFIRVYTPN